MSTGGQIIDEDRRAGVISRRLKTKFIEQRKPRYYIIPVMTLRLGLLVDTLSVRAWIARLAEKLSALEGVEIIALIEGSEPSPAGVLDAYLRFERRFLHGVPDLSYPVNLRQTLPDVQVISPSQIRDRELDILVSFQDAPQYNLPARLGVWTWNDISRAAGFRQVLNRVPLTSCVLSAHLPNGEVKTLRRAVFSTDWFSAARNRNRVYIKASSTLLWTLKKLILQGGENLWDEAQDESDFEAPPGAQKSVTRFQIAALIWKQAGRALEKKFRPQETWLVFAEKNDGLIPVHASRKKLVAPPDKYWADPIAIEHEGKTYLFVEEYAREQRRGRIACLTLDDHARVVENQTALERPYHLSYPFIFEYQGGTYMLPETSSNRALELYHCIKFPNQWDFVKTLMNNVYAVDATLLQRDGRWWLFANLMTEQGASSWDELHLFFADNPLAAEWTPHPLNPILSDARVARPAGPLFTHDGILYRPSQDSSQRYGYALNLNRVDVLNEREYAETRVEKILPPSGLLTTHTYSRANGWIFTDGITRNVREAR